MLLAKLLFEISILESQLQEMIQIEGSRTTSTNIIADETFTITEIENFVDNENSGKNDIIVDVVSSISISRESSSYTKRRMKELQGVYIHTYIHVFM
jgi:hypothetical protein